MRPALVIGLTGGIGTGKSTVARLFAEHGVAVIDADDLAREVVEPGAPAYDEVRDAFGEQVLTATGELDRRRLRQLIFTNQEHRRRLEAIVHPRVYAEMKRRLDEVEGPYAIVVVPLLVESGGSDLVDRILVVDASEEIQIRRTSLRDETPPEAVARILDAQLDRQSRLAAADDVLTNAADEASLDAAVASLHRRYLAEAERFATRRREMKE